ncbi:MAG: glycosyltransferase family 2 protein [Elusimicrobia bacterium]|nr:glycosyltransferase family 2 protein [Elusimicrobiota bacterium]
MPCLNEERNVSRFETALVKPLEDLGVPFELVFVDDGSRDGTFRFLSRLVDRHRNVRVVRHPSNLGLGMALRTGFASCGGDWIATLDADLTFRPSQLRNLLRRQRETGADLVSGSPFLRPKGLNQASWYRRLPSAAANQLYRRVLGGAFTSYTPILRLYRASALKSLPLKSRGFEINAEIAARFMLTGLKIAETPALLTTRRHGVSKLSPLKETARHFLLLAKLVRERGRLSLAGFSRTKKGRRA